MAECTFQPKKGLPPPSRDAGSAKATKYKPWSLTEAGCVPESLPSSPASGALNDSDDTGSFVFNESTITISDSVFSCAVKARWLGMCHTSSGFHVSHERQL